MVVAGGSLQSQAIPIHYILFHRWLRIEHFRTYTHASTTLVAYRRYWSIVRKLSFDYGCTWWRLFQKRVMRT